MKHAPITFLLFLLFCFVQFGCEMGKEKTHKEINIEKKKINDSLIKATITTTFKKGKEITEEVKIIEGTPEEVNASLEAFKKETLKVNTQQPHQSEAHDMGKQVTEKKLHFTLSAKSSSTTSGMVMLSESEGKVTLEAHINGLTPGVHAIHLHEKADCSSEDGKSTGGHWNPTFEPHGAWGSETGFHRGDIGNFIADETGHGMIKFTTDLWCIGCADETKNIVGKAVIVHQGEDDLTSQPSGAAGARVSCAGIIQ